MSRGTEFSDELFHERSLAETTAWVRIVLTLLNVLVVLFDPKYEFLSTKDQILKSSTALGLFLFYALLACWLLRTRRIRLSTYAYASPILDLVFASNLLLVHEVYNKPFNLWYVFAVMVSGFGRIRALPFIMASMALVAHMIVALIVPDPPNNIMIFTVRTGYLYAVAAVFSMISVHLLENSRMIVIMEDAARRFAAAITDEEVTGALLQRIHDSLKTQTEGLCLTDGRCFPQEAPPNEGTLPATTWELDVGQEQLGTLRVCRKKPLTKREESLARTLCERAATALLRIRLCADLTEAARSMERVELADRLHDTYLQRLAAMDLRAEVARRLAGDANGPLLVELNMIKDIARRSASELRELFDMTKTSEPAGPATVRRVVRDRWPVGAGIDIAGNVVLSDPQWRAVEKLVREGLNNAKRHANASRVSLRISRTSGDGVLCVLKSDGAKIESPVRFGYGLSRIQKVVEQEGGRLRLQPLDTGGAELIAEFSPRS